MLTETPGAPSGSHSGSGRWRIVAEYAGEGVVNLNDADVLKIASFGSIGSVVQFIIAFGGGLGVSGPSTNRNPPSMCDPMTVWDHKCPVDGSFQAMPSLICKQCGGVGQQRHSVIEMMARYQRLHGVPPIGPHRPVADLLFAGAIGVCPQCQGAEQIIDATGTVRECSTCVMGWVVLKSPSEMEAIRDQIRERFPDLFARSPVQKADAPPDPMQGVASSLDDQTLIDASVFEAWRTSNDARSAVLGAELTSRWNSSQGGESHGTLLMFDHAILDSEWKPGDIQVPALLPSWVREALRAGNELTEKEVEDCRDLAIAQHFDYPAYCTWEVVSLQSRTGNVAYLAHIIEGDYPCDCEFVGVFRSVAAAEDAFKQHGYVSLEQCRIQRGRVPPA